MEHSATFRTRLAPTPSGLLHAGNAVSFLVTWALARARDGWILLRIDDLDQERRRMEYVEDIFRSLEWLGLDYDEGPSGPDDLVRRFSQHFRRDLYEQALDALKATGHLYACTCSRKQIRESSAEGLYSGTCRQAHHPWRGPRTAWRVWVPSPTLLTFTDWREGPIDIALNQEMGDFVVRQKNGLPAYQVASLVDDLHWRINFVVRGRDLLASTAAQLHLARLLEQGDFARSTFWHHGLLTDDQGEKLSKSRGAGALLAWREVGRGPRELVRTAAQWLGLAGEPPESAAGLLARLREE